MRASAAQIAIRHHQNVAASQAGTTTFAVPLPLRQEAAVSQLLLQSVIVPGAQTSEGKLIEAVTIPWFDIIELLKQDPNVAFQISPEKWEEIIAGAYHRA